MRLLYLNLFIVVITALSFNHKAVGIELNSNPNVDHEVKNPEGITNGDNGIEISNITSDSNNLQEVISNTKQQGISKESLTETKLIDNNQKSDNATKIQHQSNLNQPTKPLVKNESIPTSPIILEAFKKNITAQLNVFQTSLNNHMIAELKSKPSQPFRFFLNKFNHGFDNVHIMITETVVGCCAQSFNKTSTNSIIQKATKSTKNFEKDFLDTAKNLRQTQLDNKYLDELVNLFRQNMDNFLDNLKIDVKNFVDSHKTQNKNSTNTPTKTKTT